MPKEHGKCKAGLPSPLKYPCSQAVYLLAPCAAHALFTVRLPSTALHTQLLMSLAGFFSGSLIRVSPFFIISNELIS